MRVGGKRVSLFLGVVLATGTLAASASAAELMSVKNESANFRDGPGDKHAIVYSADKFYPVEVVEKKDGWAKVKDFEGDVAWVAERLLAKQETVVVEGDKVNVREKPNTTSEIAFKSERGEVFKVESHQGKWLKVVDANGDGGWIRDDMVWGEKIAASETPKGKTKGEIVEPGDKPAAAGGKPKADKEADKPGKPGKPEKGDKVAEKGDEKPKEPKEGKPGAKPAAEGGEKAKASADKADEEKADKGDGDADEKRDDSSDAKSDDKSDAKGDDGKASNADDDAG